MVTRSRPSPADVLSSPVPTPQALIKIRERFDALLDALPERREDAAALVHEMIEIDAVFGMRCAVRFDATLYGEDTPEVAGSRAKLGEALAEAGAVLEAADTWVEAAKGFARDGDPVAGRLLVDAGFGYRSVGKLDNALASFGRAIQIPEAPEVPSHKLALLGFAYVFTQQDLIEDAMQACEEGLALPLHNMDQDAAAHAELWHAVGMLADAFEAPALMGYAMRAAVTLHPSAGEQQSFTAALEAFEAEHPDATAVVPDEDWRHVVHKDTGVTVIAHPLAGLERAPESDHPIGHALELPEDG